MTRSNTRIQSGHAAQLQVAASLLDAIPTARVISVAPPGSQLPDVVIELQSNPVQFEVKYAKTITHPLVIINKHVRRNQSSELDGLISTMVGVDTTLTALIDQERLINPKIGFPSDEGVLISGKLPNCITAKRTSHAATVAAHETIISHLHEKGDNYVAVVVGSTPSIVIFHTGFGDNPLGAPLLPSIKYVKLKTYGTPSSKNGAMRVGVNISLDIDALQGLFVIPG